HRSPLRRRHPAPTIKQSVESPLLVAPPQPPHAPRAHLQNLSRRSPADLPAHRLQDHFPPCHCPLLLARPPSHHRASSSAASMPKTSPRAAPAKCATSAPRISSRRKRSRKWISSSTTRWRQRTWRSPIRG